MMKQCIARGSTRRAWLVFAVAMGLAVLALVCNGLGIGNPLIAQTVLLLSFVAGAYILVRYITAIYVYELIEETVETEADEENDGENEETPKRQIFLYIVKMQGKRAMTQAKLSLADLTAIATQKPEGYSHPILNFSPAIFAEDDTYLAFGEGKSLSVFRIHADEALKDTLRTCVPTAADRLPATETKKRKTKSIYDISDDLPHQEDKNDDSEV